VLTFFQKLRPCLIGIEACATSHHWSRQLKGLGHTVRLMPPAYVKPYVKRQKNDVTDAEAICEAVRRPPPGCPAYPGGQLCGRLGAGRLIVRRRCRSPRARHPTVKPFEQRRTTRHCHHPPGIKNSKSESYAEIGRDRLCTRPADLVREFVHFARETHPACPAYRGGQVWLVAGRSI
jgi:hypothetical protein